MSPVIGYTPRGDATRDTLLAYIGRTIPSASLGLVRGTLDQIVSHAGAGKLWIGGLTTLWAASSGMSAVVAVLNKAYEVPEARAWWKARGLAALLTVALAVLIALALTVLLYGARMGALLGGWMGFAGGFATLWSVLRWPLVVLFVLAGFLLVYRFARHLEDQKLRWITPGAVAAVGLWVAVSLGLRIYIRYFDSYSTVYGGLGAVLILLLWMYLSSAALLIGGEINSEIENAAAETGAPDAKRPGERAPRRLA